MMQEILKVSQLQLLQKLIKEVGFQRNMKIKMVGMVFSNNFIYISNLFNILLYIFNSFLDFI